MTLRGRNITQPCTTPRCHVSLPPVCSILRTCAHAVAHALAWGGVIWYLKMNMYRFPPSPRACGEIGGLRFRGAPHTDHVGACRTAHAALPRRCSCACTLPQRRTEQPCASTGPVAAASGWHGAWRSHACRSHGERRSIGRTALTFCSPAPPYTCEAAHSSTAAQQPQSVPAVVQPR